MVSALLQKYLLATLSAQVALSIINTLFVLADPGVPLALIGYWGLLQGSIPILLFFAVAECLSIAMDVVRLVLWTPFILSNLLQVPATLGTFYLVLCIFGVVVKLVGVIFSLMIRRSLQLWIRDPHRSSTVKRPVASSWLQIIPDLHDASVQPTVRILSDDVLLPGTKPEKRPVAEDTPLLLDEGGPVSPSRAGKRASMPPEPSRAPQFEYESFGNAAPK